MKTFTVSSSELDIIKSALLDRRLNIIEQSGINPINRDGRLMPINVLIRKMERTTPD